MLGWGQGGGWTWRWVIVQCSGVYVCVFFLNFKSSDKITFSSVKGNFCCNKHKMERGSINSVIKWLQEAQSRLKQRSSLAVFAEVNIRHHAAPTDSTAPHLLGWVGTVWGFFHSTANVWKGFHTAEVKQICPYCPNCSPSSKMDNVSSYVGWTCCIYDYRLFH